jgi:hypothetical protein
MREVGWKKTGEGCKALAQPAEAGIHAKAHRWKIHRWRYRGGNGRKEAAFAVGARLIS